VAEDGGDKKHDPGERKWREAAEKGQLPRSQDINAAAVVIAGAAAMVLMPGPMVRAVVGTTRFFQAGGAERLLIPEAQAALTSCVLAVGIAAAVPLMAAMVASVAASLAQTQVQLAPKALEPKWERLNVIEGFQNTYMSWTPLVELAKGVAKILVISGAVALAVSPQVIALPRLAALAPVQLLTALVDLAWTAVIAATPVMLVIAAIDYSAAFYRSNEQLKRTDQEVKDDAKQQDGDPHMKQARRQRARRIAMSVSLNAVRTADVVITNPTHFAVALRYRRGEDAAPVVVAKGLNHLALRIRAEALRSGVPRVEDRPLARALYRRCESGEPIPDDLFAPVAKVLAVVFRRRQRRS